MHWPHDHKSIRVTEKEYFQEFEDIASKKKESSIKRKKIDKRKKLGRL